MYTIVRPATFWVVSCILVLTLASAAFGQPQGTTATAANIYAVTTSNQLVRFNTRTPGNIVTVGAITGMQAGENVVGIDFRPVTGELVAVGSNSRIYRINKTSAAATFISTLSVPLSGSAFGVDFNPTVDRLRIVSDTGQNLRVNVMTGGAIVDGSINGPTAGVDAAAYTNSFSGTTTTTLYDISAATDTLYTQNPPNAGTLVTVGPLGVNITAVNGFDILSSDGSALAVLTTGVVPLTSLYTINLTTGGASSAGVVGNGLTSFRGLAVEIGTTSNFPVFGVTTANNLIRFNSSRPNTILSSVAITGLQAGENVLGIDIRPATGQIFALGSNGRIYRINRSTGAATFVGTLTTPLNGTNFGFDFNPVPDRIRITSDAEQNLRANPNDGTNVVDGTLAYAAGDANAGANPNIVASGYTNSFAGTTTTTLYNIDSNLDILTTQNPPNAGTLNTVGSLGVDATGESGFDIVVGRNTALASLQTSAAGSALYTIDLATGSAAVIGPIGGGAVVRDIAIARSGASGTATAQIDFDGDGRTDPAVFRVGENTWYVSRSSDGSFFAVPFGLASADVLTPGDYDGDGRTDISVWRASQGVFYTHLSSSDTLRVVQWGLPGDEPLARDYDGDGITDYAIARRSNGQLVWYVLNSSNGSVRIEQFGLGSDVAAPADYDGDGRIDLAVHRGDAGAPATFFVQQSTLGLAIVQWGLGGDLVVPGDYDGDGRADFAVMREGFPFTWYVLQSSNGNLAAAPFGSKPQFTVQGDYDGDGRTDFATFDPLTGKFYWLRSTDLGTVEYQFGQNGDFPVANYQTH